jgi:hypothetical protein
MMGIGKRMGLRALTAIFAVGLFCTTASADVWVTGAVCTEGYSWAGNVLDYSDGNGAYNPSSSGVWTVCPIPVAQNVGTSQQFEMRVQDSHATDNFGTCFGMIIGTNGEILSSTSSDSTLGTGEDTLSFSSTTGTSSDDFSYVAMCNVPGDNSRIENIRVF